VAIISLLSTLCVNVFAETFYGKNNKEYIPTAEEARALKTAKEVCEKEGWGWKDVRITSDDNEYFIWTKCFQMGGNAVISIDKKTGEVVRKELHEA